MKMKRAMLPVIVVVAMLLLACSVCGDIGNIKSGVEEISKQATELATMLPDEEAIDGIIEEVTAPTEIPTEAMEEPAEESTKEAEVVEEPEEEMEEVVEEPDTGGAVEEELDLDMSLSGLENLNSYRSMMYVEWEGTEGGEPSSGYLHIEYASVREPPAYEMHMTGEGFDAGGDMGLGTVSFVQVGETAYFYDGESGNWSQVPAGTFDFEEGFFFTPQDFMSGFSTSTGKRSLVPQSVNGVMCHKYTFSEKDLVSMSPDEGQITRADGEAYVAVDGGYIVKLSVEIEMVAGSDEVATFDEGTIWMVFELSDINQPITIEAPEGVSDQPAGREDIPLMPDATEVSSSADFVTYATSSSLSDVTSFYESEMPANGWEASEESIKMEDMTWMDFTKNGETASIMVSIMVSGDESSTSVVITIETE
jgi:hypothetical protein